MNPYITNDLALLEPICDLMSSELFMRRSLLASMVAGRKSLRFLLAPDGYGKTSLALTYAKLAFGLKSFWWVDSTDPRFMLDLDSCAAGRSNELERLASSRLPSLMVFDDVPKLSRERESALMDFLSSVIAKGWEVVLTSTDSSLGGALDYGVPCEDVKAARDLALRVKSQCFYAKDLLLCEDELRQLVGASGLAGIAAGSAACIPAFVLGGSAGRALFLKHLAEGVDDELDALALVSMVLQPESMRELEPFCAGGLDGLARSLVRDAPHAGFASLAESAVPLPLTEDERLLLFKRARARLHAFVPGGASEVLGEPSFELCLQDALMAKDELSLAARIVVSMGERESAAEFVRLHALELFERAEFLALAELSRASMGESCSCEIRLMRVCALLGLGDSAGALSELDSLAAHPLDPMKKALASLVRVFALAREGVAGRDSVKAHIKTLNHLLGVQGAEAGRSSSKEEEPTSFATLLAWASVESTKKGSIMASSLRRLTGKGATRESVLAAAWMVLLAMGQRRGFKVIKQLVDTFPAVSASLAFRGRAGIIECVLDACARQVFGSEAGRICGRALFARSSEVKGRIAREAAQWMADKHSVVSIARSAGQLQVFTDASSKLSENLQFGIFPGDESVQDKGIFRLFGGFELRLPLVEAAPTADASNEIRLMEGESGECASSELSELAPGMDGDLCAGEAAGDSAELSEGALVGGLAPSEPAEAGPSSEDECPDLPVEKGVIIELPRVSGPSEPLSGEDASFGPCERGLCFKGLSEPIRLRAKAQLLMSLLALNHNKELSRDWLCVAIWPAANEHSRRTSFYSLWSYITRTIRKFDCMPFLDCNRNAAVFRDGAIVFDLELADDICRRLDLDGISAYERLELLSRLRQVYRGPLLPGVRQKDIDLARSAWERRVVDAILSSTSALDLPGDPTVIEDHLSFAFGIDPTRQDVAYALMRAQRALGRYAEATETFIRCQKESLERHGIGTSARLKDLYQDVLADVS